MRYKCLRMITNILLVKQREYEKGEGARGTIILPNKSLIWWFLILFDIFYAKSLS